MKKILAFLMAVVLLSMTACGAETAPAKSADLTALYESMQDKLPSMMMLDDTTMMSFLGIDAADCTQAVVAICAEGLRVDEVWLIEAKDEAALEKLETMANTRITSRAEETVSYNPEQYAVVEKSKVYTVGNYLVLLVSPDVDGLKEIADAAIQ